MDRGKIVAIPNLKAGKVSYLTGTSITIIVVVMLILMGPAQAVSVIISGIEPSYSEKTNVQFQVSIEITSPDQFVPVTVISLDITGPVNLNRIFSVDGTPISGDPRISINPVKYPDSKDYGYGYGYGYDSRTGYGYNFGNVDGYGIGRKDKLKFIYDVSIDITNLPEGAYSAIANLNTGKSIKPAFSSVPNEFLITSIVYAKIDFEPKSLNLDSKGKFVLVDIELPDGYNAAEINISSIRLNGIVPALANSEKVGDNDLKVKFDRASVQAILVPGENTIIITGEFLTGGIEFTGSDIIKVI